MPSHQTHRRVLAISAILFLFISSYLAVTRLYNSSFMRSAIANAAYNNAHKNDPPIFLSAADFPMADGNSYNRPAMDRLTLVANLPEEHLPTAENKKRLLIVGDVHGMDAALEKLLKKASFDPKKDHLIAAGDMINKGPDSPGVISRLIHLRASAVRGNHEDRILLSLREAEESGRVPTTDESKKGVSEFLATGRSLSKEQLAWVHNLPVILAIEPLKIYVVHGGLVPGLKPELQDPWAVMNMRTIIYPRQEVRKKEMPEKYHSPTQDTNSTTTDLSSSNQTSSHSPKNGSTTNHEEGNLTPAELQSILSFTDRDPALPTEGRTGEKWSHAWNAYQKRLAPEYRYTVVYGHDAKRGFQEEKYTVGLDSGCVKGGMLTALIIEGKPGGYKRKILQVECKKPS